MYQTRPGVKFILASGSPRRREMLQQFGITFKIISADIDESLEESELAVAAVQRLALQKGQTVAKLNQDSWVLAADTMVARDNRIFGKPENQAEAIDMLSSLQGAVHQVHGAFALINSEQGVEECRHVCTEVGMRQLQPDLIEAYVRSGEPFDKAGGYAVQGLAAPFVEYIQGSYTNVVGLDIGLCLELLLSCSVVELRPV